MRASYTLCGAPGTSALVRRPSDNLRHLASVRLTCVRDVFSKCIQLDGFRVHEMDGISGKYSLTLGGPTRFLRQENYMFTIIKSLCEKAHKLE